MIYQKIQMIVQKNLLEVIKERKNDKTLLKKVQVINLMILIENQLQRKVINLKKIRKDY